MIRQIATVVFLVVTTFGCQSTPTVPTSETLLVTFPVTRFSDVIVGGSQRAYHGGSNWSASLHTRQLMKRFAKTHGLRHVDDWAIRELNVHCVLFASLDGRNVEHLIPELRKDGRIDSVQRNHQFHGMLTKHANYDDPLIELQYGKYAKTLEQLHQVTLGEDVKVGLIDSYVDMAHPDLAGQVKKHYALSKDKSPKGQVHGTAVAGVIGALGGNGVGVVGIAPGAPLFVYGACRLSNERTVCDSFEIAKAIAHAIEDDVDILNLSLAGPHDPLLERLLAKAISDNKMIVIAADNASDAKRNFPAKLDGVHAARIDHSLWFARQEQMSTQAGGGYQVFYGTSIASAGVSGVAALLRSQSSTPDTNALLDRLLRDGCTTSGATELARDLGLEGLCE